MLFGFPLIDDMYTYPTAILALFSHSQIVGVVKDVALLPREEGLRWIHPAVLVAACLLKHLRLMTLAAQLGEEPRQLVVRGRTSTQLKRMMKLCQPSI
jgi:hypothetical protein